MINETVTANLLAIAKAYSAGTGKSLTQVSHDFYGNGSFFAELKRGGRSLSVEKLDSMIEAFRDSWPADTPWPPVRAVMMGKKPPRN